MPPKSASHDFKDKQKVFAKMSGYPWWPAFITPTEYVPKHVQKAKKKGTPYCVIFIPDGDFHWSSEKGLKEFKPGNNAKELTKLDSKTIARMKDVKFLRRRLSRSPKKPATFPEAIAASDDLAFDDFITIFQEDGDEDDDEEEDDEEDKAKEDKAKEHTKEEEEQDEGPEEFEESEQPAKKSAPLKSRNRAESRRRRSSRTQEVEDEGEDGDVEDQYQEEIPKNKRKRGSVSQANNISTNGKKRKSTDAAVKAEPDAESNKKPKLENSSDEDTANAAGAAAASIKSSKVPVSDEEKQHQLYLCRIKLQRTLIQRDLDKSPPTANELSVVRLILYRLVNFPVDKELLKKTKLYKVMRCIIKNPDLEYSESFKLHELCREILTKWDPYIQQILYEKDKLNNDKNANPNSRLLSVKNGGSGFNDDSEVSGIEQSLPEIEQSKDEETESVDKKTDETISTDQKVDEDVSAEKKDNASELAEKEGNGKSQEAQKVEPANGSESKKQEAEQVDLQSERNKQLDSGAIKTENTSEAGEAINEDETKESESAVDGAETESKSEGIIKREVATTAKDKISTAAAAAAAESVDQASAVARAAVNL
ncbi:hypothetical protein CANMA_001108 [Candida margitis]|uniref:uncharacterized protein n=1 Tax=Candida margitis TaxID=1775924 RepID=UPI002227FEB8|nr:uncharacterized protein CANMA_001108 [Candida margitis]KAI5969818.1 hypothetical protein CANMA_001108 [Candida margitis]